MSLKKISFAATPSSDGYTCSVEGDQSGDYVPAQVAESLEKMLRKMVWNIFYGKPLEIPNIAVEAESILAKLPTS